MTVLEFLTGAAGTWIVTAGKLILDNRCARLLGTGVVLGCSLLVAVDELLLTNLLLRLGILLALGVLLGSSLLHLLHLRNLSAGKDRGDAVVHLVDHGVPHLG